MVEERRGEDRKRQDRTGLSDMEFITVFIQKNNCRLTPI